MLAHAGIRRKISLLKNISVLQPDWKYRVRESQLFGSSEGRDRPSDQSAPSKRAESRSACGWQEVRENYKT
jgi:hypothetical protein